MISSAFFAAPTGGAETLTRSASDSESMKWLCGSMNPGTSVWPLRSRSSVPGPRSAFITVSFCPTITILPSLIATASADGAPWLTVTMGPPYQMVSAFAASALIDGIRAIGRRDHTVFAIVLKNSLPYGLMWQRRTSAFEEGGLSHATAVDGPVSDGRVQTRAA